MIDEAMLANVALATDDAVLGIDQAMCIHYANAGAEQIFGFDKADLIGLSLAGVLPDAARFHKKWINQTSRVRMRPSAALDRRELCGFRADGSWFPAKISIIPARFQGPSVYLVLAKDMSIERAYQQVLSGNLDQRAQLLTAIDASLTSITIADVTHEDTPLTYVSKGFESLTGYSSEECLGRNCSFLQGPETDPKTAYRIRQAILAEDSLCVTIRNYRKDGTAFWNRLTLSPVKIPDGIISSYVGIQKDVSNDFARFETLAMPANTNSLAVLA